MREGWTYKELGNLCTIKGRIGFRGYTREDLVNEGQGAITLSPSNIIEDKLDLSKCSFISWFKYEESPEIMVFNGDIIYAKTASIGKVAIIDNLPEKATINPQFVVLKEIKCDNKYLYYALRSSFFKEQASSITRGVAIPTISQANLSLLKIPVPSLQEQNRIVAELDLLTEIIDKQKQQLKELDNLAQSIFYDMFGNPVQNEKGWKMKPLKKISSLIVNGNTPKGGESVYVSDGIMFFRSQNVWRNRINYEDVAFIDADTNATMQKSVLHRNDILITKTGRINTENSSLGRAALYEGETGAANINGHVYLIRLNEGVSHQFVLRILIGTEYRDYIRSVCVGGIDKRQINKEHVEEFPIILPPLELQESFAKKIQSIKSQKESINCSIAESQKLFDYTMDKYFG